MAREAKARKIDDTRTSKNGANGTVEASSGNAGMLTQSCAKTIAGEAEMFNLSNSKIFCESNCLNGHLAEADGKI